MTKIFFWDNKLFFFAVFWHKKNVTNYTNFFLRFNKCFFNSKKSWLILKIFSAHARFEKYWFLNNKICGHFYKLYRKNNVKISNKTFWSKIKFDSCHFESEKTLYAIGRKNPIVSCHCHQKRFFWVLFCSLIEIKGIFNLWQN